MKEMKRLHSRHVVGITKDHDDHRDSAPMHSTGNLVLFRNEATNPRFWYLEYKCEEYNEFVYYGSPDVVDRIRSALMENGVVPE